MTFAAPLPSRCSNKLMTCATFKRY
jgi:hypothetical protein